MNRWVFRRPHDYRVKKAHKRLLNLAPPPAIYASADSTLVLSQTVSLAGSIYNKSVTASLVFDQSVSIAGSIWSRSTSSTVVFDQTIGTTKVYVRSVESTLVLSQLASKTTVIVASSTVIFSQLVTYVVGNAQVTSSTLSFTQELSNPLLSKLTISQQVSLAGSLYNKNITDPISFVSKIARYFSVSSVITFSQDVYKIYPTSNTLTLDHSLSGEATRHAINTIVFVQDATYVRIRREASNVLSLTQLATYDAVFNLVVSSYWTTLTAVLNPGPRSDLFVRQTISVKRVRYFSASNLIVFDSAADHSKIEFVTSAISLDHSIIGQKVPIRFLVDQFTTNQSLILQQLLNGAIGNTVTFAQEATGTKVKHLVILQNAEDIIILPRPLLNDKETGTDSIDIKRSMSGIVRTYVKSSSTKKLSYTFSVKTDKALELKMFIEKHPTDTLKMENFKGEIWQVQLTNDPFEFVYESKWTPSKEKVLITLEFEGTKLYG